MSFNDFFIFFCHPTKLFPFPEPSASEQINHWSMLADNMESSSLRSFEMIENYLSQDLLRVTGQNKEDADALLMIDGRPTKDAFEGKFILGVFTKVYKKCLVLTASLSLTSYSVG